MISKNKVIVLFLLSLVCTILLYTFFMSSKHIEALSKVNPFLEDPYDYVGSFAVILSPIFLILSIVRILIIKLIKFEKDYVYIIRGFMLIGWMTFITMLVDILAVLLSNNIIPQSPPQVILYISIVFLLALSIIIIEYGFKLQYPMSKEPKENIFNFIFEKYKHIFKSNPTKYPIRVSIFIGALIGVVIMSLECSLEGVSDNLTQTLEIAGIFFIIPFVFISSFFLLSGNYLGFWHSKLVLNRFSYISLFVVNGAVTGGLFTLTANSNIYLPALTLIGATIGSLTYKDA